MSELKKEIRQDIKHVMDAFVTTISRAANIEYAVGLRLLASACEKLQSREAARPWIAENLVPSKEKQFIRSLKHNCEHACNSGHLQHADFRQLLIEDGRFEIDKDGYIFCTVRGESAIM